MSKILEKKEVAQEVIVGRECDNCHRRETNKGKLDGWFYFNEMHGGWGNDNLDSVEWYDVCSPVCFVKLARVRAQEIGSYSEAEVADIPTKFLLGLFDLIDANKGQ